MLAILRLSNGVNALGDFDVRLSGFCGDPDRDMVYNCVSKKHVPRRKKSSGTYIALRGCYFTAEIVIRIIVHQDTRAEVIQSRVLVAFEYCPREPEDVRSNLRRISMQDPAAIICTHQPYLLGQIIESLLFRLDNAMLFCDETEQNSELDVT